MQYFENCINPYFIHSGQQSVNIWKLKKLCAGDLGEEHCLFCLFVFCPTVLCLVLNFMKHQMIFNC